jgi:antitoxin MazE
MANRVSKWGNSLAIRIPRALADQAGLREGQSVTLTVDADGSLVVRPDGPAYSLDKLVRRIGRRNRHAQTSTGARTGRESW